MSFLGQYIMHYLLSDLGNEVLDAMSLVDNDNFLLPVLQGVSVLHCHLIRRDHDRINPQWDPSRHLGANLKVVPQGGTFQLGTVVQHARHLDTFGFLVI